MRLADSVRFSRDGDQFHYVWAARQSLRLLEHESDLKLLVVEGASPTDSRSSAGEEVIDLAEYYGSDDLATAARVVYRQFKHTTVQGDEPWTASWMKKAIVGFAERYAAIASEQPRLVGQLSFVLTTNYPAAAQVHEAVSALRSGGKPATAKGRYAFNYLKTSIKPVLEDQQLSSFFAQVAIEDNAPGLRQLRDQYEGHNSGLLPGMPGDLHIIHLAVVSEF